MFELKLSNDAPAISTLEAYTVDLFEYTRALTQAPMQQYGVLTNYYCEERKVFSRTNIVQLGQTLDGQWIGAAMVIKKSLGLNSKVLSQSYIKFGSEQAWHDYNVAMIEQFRGDNT